MTNHKKFDVKPTNYRIHKNENSNHWKQQKKLSKLIVEIEHHENTMKLYTETSKTNSSNTDFLTQFELVIWSIPWQLRAMFTRICTILIRVIIGYLINTALRVHCFR